MLMMPLALASYLLLQATPQPMEPEPERLLTNEPDFFMRRFSVKVFAPNGTLQTEVYGAEARHHPDTDRTVIDTARIRTYSAQRQLSTATAREIISNGEGTVYELRGDAVVVRQAARNAAGQRLPRMEFHGEFLRVSTDPEHIESDLPVLLIRDKDQMTADTLDYRGDSRVVELNGRVRAQLAPR
nr:LPS export ABC transporter periplasmic protein LptC [Hydrogenophaga aromaticivorans]